GLAADLRSTGAWHCSLCGPSVPDVAQPATGRWSTTLRHGAAPDWRCCSESCLTPTCTGAALDRPASAAHPRMLGPRRGSAPDPYRYLPHFCASGGLPG